MKLPGSNTIKYFSYLLAVIILILVAFNAFVSFQFHKGIAKSVDNPDRWPVGSYAYDSVIGIDFSSGISARMPNGSFYVKSHQLGYRIGEQEDSVAYQPDGILSLGCSFTYGDEINSEQTFTQLIADSLKLPAYNYGICSFSYTHALLKAKKLKDAGVLDKLKPKYVVLGCWNELPNRSRSPFPPMTSGDLPFACAYFAKCNTGCCVQPPPLNTSYIPEIVELYRKEGTALNFKKFNKIFMLVPQYLRDRMTNTRLQEKLQANSADKQVSNFDIYDYYFTDIENIFAAYNSQIIVLLMSVALDEQPDEGLIGALAKHTQIMLVDGHKGLEKYRVPLSDYVKIHPQPLAHLAYAREAVDFITLLEQEKLQIGSTAKKKPKITGKSTTSY